MKGLYDPADFIGTIAAPADEPADIPWLRLDLRDFEADGKRYTARSTLRTQASFSIAMVVTAGRVEVGGWLLKVLEPGPGRSFTVAAEDRRPGEWRLEASGTHGGVPWRFERAPGPPGPGGAAVLEYRMVVGGRAISVTKTERGLLTAETYTFSPGPAQLAEQLSQFLCRPRPEAGAACDGGFCLVPGDPRLAMECFEGRWRPFRAAAER